MNQTILNEVISLIKSGVSETQIRKLIRDKTGLKKTQGNDLFNKIKAGTYELPQSNLAVKVTDENGLEFVSNKYTYNRDSDVYVINLKCRTKPMTIRGSRHRAICRDYSSWHSDLTSHEICTKFSLTPEIFNEYRKIFNLTKEREPLSAEELLEDSVDGSVEAILEQKRYSVYQKYEKEEWKTTQSEASNWRAFKAHTLDAARTALDGWEPVRYSNVKSPKAAKHSNYIFIVGANDWHIGEKFNKEKGFSGKDFNSEIAVKLIDDYANQIEESVKARNYKFKECVVVINGDILNSCFDGKTVKGTQLHNDKVNEELFEITLNTTVRFIERLATVFPQVTIPFLPGNHDGPLLSILGLAVKAYFRNVPSVTILVSKRWAEIMRFGNVAILMMHGGAVSLKSAVPQPGLKLKSYLSDMWMSREEGLTGCKTKIVLTGHFHRFFAQDMGNFDFYCLGGLPLGDEYSDSLNLRSKPRQNALILNEDQCIETLHYYF